MPAASAAPRSRRRLLAVIAAVLLVGVALTWVVVFSPVLAVRTIQVHGTSGDAAAAVIAAARVRTGTPLVRVDTGAVAGRVRALPEIAGARVRTSFPSTLIIDVTERVAVGVIADSGHFVLVDDTGAQFRTVTAAPESLPQFVLPQGDAARATGAAVAHVAAALTPALRAQTASIQALGPESITLVLTDKRVVRWGSAADSDAKAAVLAALLGGDQGRAAHQIDVSDPDRPFTR